MNECLLCGGFLTVIYSGISSSYDRNNRYSIGQCEKCRLCQTFPRVTRMNLDSIYSEVYAYDLHEAIRPEKSFRAARLVNLFGIPQADSIALEIGCGEGILLKYLQSRGIQIFGCELDKSSTEKANRSLGDKRVENLQVEVYLQEVKIKPDYVYISHTLEHLENPLKVMQILHSLCRPNTKIIIAVPNISNVRWWFFPRKWGYWQVPLHVTHFSRESLNQLLRDAGFESNRWAYRNSDLLTLGNFFLNLFNRDSEFSRKGKTFTFFIAILSRIHCLSYYFGKNDLIVLCTPK